MSRPTQVAASTYVSYLYRTITVYGQTFQIVPVQNIYTYCCSYTPNIAVTILVWALSISIATTLDIDNFFLFLLVLRCFSSQRLLLNNKVTGLQPAGLPHSDISGSIPVCRSPELFAAYHVFRRL